jgi:alcohol dehydrogenase
MTDKVELELRKFVAPEFVFGDGARMLVGRYARNLGASKALVVTDPGVAQAGWAGDVTRSLEEEDLPYAVFHDVTQNPKADEVMAGARVYEAEGCNSIVAVGGGSPMDCAKGIGVVVSNGGDILQYEGVDKVSNPLAPLICVPTTAGSSADVSQFAIITDTRRKAKIAIISKTIVPDVSLIDPRSTTTMSRELTAHTGMDALCHAFEAYVSNANSPITDSHALEAIRIIWASLLDAVNRPHDMQARAKMMLGSLFAGLAFSNASLGIVHAMAHSLGGLLNLSHGECNAVLLEHVVRFNFKAAPDRYRRIAEILGAEGASAPIEVETESLVRKIGDMRRALGVTQNLGALGMRIGDIPDLARNAIADPCLVTNPATARLADIEEIYERAL